MEELKVAMSENLRSRLKAKDLLVVELFDVQKPKAVVKIDRLDVHLELLDECLQASSESYSEDLTSSKSSKDESSNASDLEASNIFEELLSPKFAETIEQLKRTLLAKFEKPSQADDEEMEVDEVLLRDAYLDFDANTWPLLKEDLLPKRKPRSRIHEDLALSVAHDLFVKKLP